MNEMEFFKTLFPSNYELLDVKDFKDFEENIEKKHFEQKFDLKNTTDELTEEFLDQKEKIWKELPTLQQIKTLEEAKAFKKAQQEMCNYMVDFRIVEEVA